MRQVQGNNVQGGFTQHERPIRPFRSTTGAFGDTFTVVSKNCEISFKNGADQLSNSNFLIKISVIIANNSESTTKRTRSV